MLFRSLVLALSLALGIFSVHASDDIRKNETEIKVNLEKENINDCKDINCIACNPSNVIKNVVIEEITKTNKN